MVEYEYRCGRCGSFTVQRPMGTAARAEACPGCGAASPRRYLAPGTRQVPAPLARALAMEEASADHPEVVHELPPRRRPRRVTTHPLHRQLPRP